MNELCADLVLGHDFMKLHDKIVFEMGGPRQSVIIGDATCSVAQALIEPPKLFKNLAVDCKPIATKSRHYSAEDRIFIRQEIEKLLQEGIIEPAVSPWRAQVLVTKNERHKKRMVIDYSQTNNRFTELNAYPIPRIDEQINKIARGKVFSTLDLKSAYYQIPLSEKNKPFTAFEANGKLYQYCRLPFGVKNGVPAFQKIMDDVIESHNLTGTFAYLDNITVVGKNQQEHDKNLQAFLDTAKALNLTFNDSKSIFSVNQISLLGYTISNGNIKPDAERFKPLIELPAPRNKKEKQRIVGMLAYYAKWISSFSEKLRSLVQATEFPLPRDAISAFETLKNDLLKARLDSIDESAPFTVECDASDYAIAAVLSQNGRPVAFMSRTLSSSETRYPAVEKEATSDIEAVRKWAHYLHGKTFTLITDHKSVVFMFDHKNRGKIKNNKIALWRIELGAFSYNIVHRPGRENVAPDTLFRVCAVSSSMSLKEVHENLGHPGVTRLLHFVKIKNLPFSLNDVKTACSQCRTCAEIKPRFYKLEPQTLIKATQPWERVSIDFKGPITSREFPYMLTVVDEYSRFPFAFPCKDARSQTVISCLSQLFSTFGMPNFVHSDRGASFMSHEFKTYLHSRGVATSRTTPYNPTGNSQCERCNQTIWRTVRLFLRDKNLNDESWHLVLQDALHSIRSLLCTSTNTTPHERFFVFPRRSMLGKSVPSWLTSDKSDIISLVIKIFKTCILTNLSIN